MTTLSTRARGCWPTRMPAGGSACLGTGWGPGWGLVVPGALPRERLPPHPKGSVGDVPAGGKGTRTIIPTSRKASPCQGPEAAARSACWGKNGEVMTMTKGPGLSSSNRDLGSQRKTGQRRDLPGFRRKASIALSGGAEQSGGTPSRGRGQPGVIAGSLA